MKIPNDIISGVAVLGLCGIGAIGASGLPAASMSEWAGPATLPWFSLGCTAFFGVALVISGLIKRARATCGFGISIRTCAFFVLWLCYMILMTWLGRWISHQDLVEIPANGGFAIATCLFLLVALPVLGRRKPLEIICVAVGTTAVLVLVFSGFFKVQLP